jgi:hypothetical protein
LALSPLPFRIAGWAHGGTDPSDAFRRWAIFGDDPACLPRGSARGSLESAVVSRVLLPEGDLFDVPLRRMELTFRRPARYMALLRALGRGPLDWSGILREARGVRSGGQLAPYLTRLEGEGMIRSDHSLDARPASRNRRYSIADPLLAFWFAWVLPRRSLLAPLGAEVVWREHIRPSLGPHFQTWMEEAARRWLRDHAEEALGVGAREAGALWGEEADFPVAGRLANGQVCFGQVEWESRSADPAREMAERIRASRYGIGRESRTPIFFRVGGEDEAVRRMVARAPYATVVSLDGLMGTNPFAG